MIKLKSLILLFIVTVISYISINYDINLLHPYYVIRDYLLYPVKAINNKEITISDNLKNSLINDLKSDIEHLQKINNLSLSLSNFNYINATIIERNREYWFNSLSINKGAKDGIEIDMAVIDSNGLIGRISSVNNNTSVVKLITTNDTKNKVSAVIKGKEKNIYGIINGYDSKNNFLYLTINENYEIENNLDVVTTGLGGVFPSGILIGKTHDVIYEKDEITRVVRIIPSSNLEGERYVSILQRKEISNN